MDFILITMAKLALVTALIVIMIFFIGIGVYAIKDFWSYRK